MNPAHGEPGTLAAPPTLVLVDNSYAVLDLLHCCQSLREPVTLIARLRLDAGMRQRHPVNLARIARH